MQLHANIPEQFVDCVLICFYKVLNYAKVLWGNDWSLFFDEVQNQRYFLSYYNLWLILISRNIPNECPTMNINTLGQKSNKKRASKKGIN